MLFININRFHSFRSKDTPHPDEIWLRELIALGRPLKQRAKGTLPQFMLSLLQCELPFSKE